MNTIRILLADDHGVMRAGLKMFINAEAGMKVVGEASNGVEACAAAEQLKPDVLIMDLSMPDMDGIQATEAIRLNSPDTKILVLTVHEDAGYVRQLFQKGAAGYLAKSAVAEQLPTAIRQVMSGGTYLDPQLAAKLVEQTSGSSANGHRDDRALSEREADVLRRVAWGHSNAEIAAQLHVSVRSVETYKARMMQKLGLRTRSDVVRYALDRGWLKPV